jgi:bla regulator protein BlaR1
MAQLFELILKTSAYGTAVGILLLFLKALLKNRLDASWHYLLWMVLLLKLLLPFGPQSAVSLFNVIPPIASVGIAELSPAISQEAPPHNRLVMLEREEVSQAPAEKASSMGRTDILPYIWAAGAVGMVLWLAASSLMLNKRVQRNAQGPSDRIGHILEGCKEKLRIRRNIPLLLQQEITMPSLFGAVRPKILLTQKAAEWEDQELQYILLHELAHYKRGDILVNYLLLLLQALPWFNPLMWYCFKRVREDMELATDQYILSLLEPQEHRDYGRVLLGLAGAFLRTQPGSKAAAWQMTKRAWKGGCR